MIHVPAMGVSGSIPDFHLQNIGNVFFDFEFKGKFKSYAYTFFSIIAAAFKKLSMKNFICLFSQFNQFVYYIVMQLCSISYACMISRKHFVSLQC